MPQMAPYTASRIEESSPFTYTGLDYLGPLYVKVKYRISYTKGVGLPIYLLSSQSCSFRNH